MTAIMPVTTAEGSGPHVSSRVERSKADCWKNAVNGHKVGEMRGGNVGALIVAEGTRGTLVVGR